MEKIDINTLIKYADTSIKEIKDLITRLAKEGNLVAINKYEEIKKIESPCRKCGTRGYLGPDIDHWGCPNEGTDTCPYCNGRGYIK